MGQVESAARQPRARPIRRKGREPTADTRSLGRAAAAQGRRDGGHDRALRLRRAAVGPKRRGRTPASRPRGAPARRRRGGRRLQGPALGLPRRHRGGRRGDEDPTARTHAAQVRTHVQKLSSKEYWKQFERSPDFVVCFVPGDALLSAAFEADPGLTEYALSNHVLLTGPTALIALLQTVSYGWRQERLARHTERDTAPRRALYERLGKFANHLAKLRSSLDHAVGSYNDAVTRSSVDCSHRTAAEGPRHRGRRRGPRVPRAIATLPVTAGAPELEVTDVVGEELDA